MKYFLTMLLWISMACRADTLEVITLQYKQADEVIPIIKPFLSAGGVLSGSGSQLILRTDGKNLREIRKIVESLDRAPRNLVITVHRGEVSSERERLYSTESASEGNESHVRVLEGSPAFIRTGQSVPNPAVTMGPYGVAVTNAYNDVSSGFYVLATLNGDNVTLDASPLYEKPVDGGIDRQKLSTRISGKLGQWLELGGTGESSARSEGYRTRTDRIWIRVDLP